jgi:hypothetical protein
MLFEAAPVSPLADHVTLGPIGGGQLAQREADGWQWQA